MLEMENLPTLSDWQNSYYGNYYISKAVCRLKIIPHQNFNDRIWQKNNSIKYVKVQNTSNSQVNPKQKEHQDI